MVRGSRVAIKHVIHDMVTRTLLMELRRRAIKRWVRCDDMDRRLKIPHSAKVECGFRTTLEECLYDSGQIGHQYRASLYNTIQYNTIQYFILLSLALVFSSPIFSFISHNLHIVLFLSYFNILLLFFAMLLII